MNIHNELHGDSFAARLNWLRAAVLGANDGIISIAALVVGVAGSNTSTHTLFIAVFLQAMIAGIAFWISRYFTEVHIAVESPLQSRQAPVSFILAASV